MSNDIRKIENFGERIALINDANQQKVTYAELAGLVFDCQKKLPKDAKQLLLAEVSNCVESIVIYLSALSSGIPIILISKENELAFQNIDSIFKPTLSYRFINGGWLLQSYPERTMGSQFPRELALLLSTSGTTGSPKLVRLSYENVNSNAASIAQYLGLKQSDRAITSLPMNYSYGLSVINSHLIVGASLVLTEDSVINNSFWKTFNDEKVTSFAGVPYSYELLSKIGFENFSLPSLEYMTQAGGRLSEGLIKYFGEIAKRQGFKFYVMYGQTEATARMSYLPPNKTLAYPSSIGIPIPGGKFELIDESNNIISEASRTGELVYSGPNVMLGYAEKISDLFKDREIEFLKTGDLAKYDENGLYYIVGRKSRFLKIFGNRIGLDDVENMINASGYSVICGGTDKLMIVMTRQKGCKDVIETLIKEMFGLTREYFRVIEVDDFPVLSSGKINYRELNEISEREIEKNRSEMDKIGAINDPISNTNSIRSNVRHAFEQVFERNDFDDTTTFQSLGGDSLSYVQMTILLEQNLGKLPVGWQDLSIRTLSELKAIEKPSTIAETSMSIRGLACILVVAYHVIGGKPYTGLKVENIDVRFAFDYLGLLKMPLFAFISGYFYAMQPLESHIKRFIFIKFRQLIIPMLVVGTIFAAMKGWVPGVNTPNVDWSLLHINPIGHFWFVESLFFIFVIVAICDKKYLYSKNYFALFFLASVLMYIFKPQFHFDFLSINGLIRLMPHFLFGMAYYRFGFLFNKFALALLFSIMSIIYWVVDDLSLTNTWETRFFILALAFVSSSLLLQSGIRISFLKTIAVYSFSIYIFHVFFTAFSRITLFKMGVDNYYVLFFMGCFLGILGPIIIDKIASLNRVTRVILLGKR